MMCRLPGGLPSESPVTHHPQGTGRQTAHQRGCTNPPPPTASSPPPLPPGGLSLPAKLHSAPSPGKEPPGCSHTPLAGPTISDTYPHAHPAQYHLRQEATQLSGALAAHSSQAAQLSARRHHGTAQQRLPPSPWPRPGTQPMEESDVARPHPGCTVTPTEGYFRKFRRQKLFLEAPQLPRAREGPRTAQPQTDWPQQRVPRGPLPARAGSRQRPQ